MAAQASVNQPQAKNERFKNVKRRQVQHSADIVFTKGMSIQTMPSFTKQLKGITDCIIGLQYVWEYRSPSKSVPPHYQCKLCAVSRLQHDMIAHVKGWKHFFKYLKKAHPDKVTYEEEEAIKDPVVRKVIKEVAADVEKAEGRGQLKVILKEPSEVPAFKGLRSAIPKVKPPPLQALGAMGPMRPLFNPMFSDGRFQGEFPPQDGPSDYPGGDYGEPSFGGYRGRQDFFEMDQSSFSDDLDNHPSGNSFGPHGGRDGYGRSGPVEEGPSRMYPDEHRGNLMNRPMDRPGLMGAALENSNTPNALLTYLDTFQIENESDAQLVLKVTQKLTDVLMEYRLRSVSKGPSLNSFPMSSTNFSSPSRLMGSNDIYSSCLSGPSKYYK